MRFPLIVWEATKEFKEEYEAAAKRFDWIKERLYSRGFSCTFFGDLRCDDDGFPEVWLNDSLPFRARFRFVNDAFETALKYGRLGWWSLDELEEFAGNKGPIVDEAMWKLGYRRHKKDATKWAKITVRETLSSNPLSQKLWHDKHDKSYLQVSDDELKRLESLVVMPNESAGISRTYDLGVGKRGLIYVVLLANPFTPDLYALGEQLHDRGHIAKKQDGFEIVASNVKFGENNDGVYIKAVKPDASVTECVWPARIPKEKIYYLGNDLVSRINGEQ